MWDSHAHIGVVQWTLLAMNADRLVALSWPFWARAHVTRRATILVILIILLFTFALALFAINIYGVLPTANNLIGITCIGYSKGSPRFYIIKNSVVVQKLNV